MNTGEVIAARRRELGVTQAQLAEKLGVSFQAVSSWERGEYMPDSERIIALARALDMSAARLLEGCADAQLNVRERMFSEEHMYTFVKAAALARGFEQTARALPLMRRLHAGQTRKGPGEVPYIIHPLTVACSALALGMNDDTVAAALLHDVCEDCGARSEDLPLGAAARRAVELLTFECAPGEDKAAAKRRYYDAIADDRVASLVKVLDRLNNVSNMAAGFTRERMADYIAETEEYVMPLLDSLKACTEYSDAAFLIKYHMRSVLETIKRLL